MIYKDIKLTNRGVRNVNKNVVGTNNSIKVSILIKFWLVDVKHWLGRKYKINEG